MQKASIIAGVTASNAAENSPALDLLADFSRQFGVDSVSVEHRVRRTTRDERHGRTGGLARVVAVFGHAHAGVGGEVERAPLVGPLVQPFLESARSPTRNPAGARR